MSLIAGGYSHLLRHPGDLNAAVNSQLPETQMTGFVCGRVYHRKPRARLRDHAPLGVCVRTTRSPLGVPERRGGPGQA